MKYKTEVVQIVFDVEINYRDAEARAAAIKDAANYFKSVRSSEGYWIDSKTQGKLIE